MLDPYRKTDSHLLLLVQSFSWLDLNGEKY